MKETRTMVWLASAVWLLAGATAMGQSESPAELRRQLESVTAERDALVQRVAALEARVAALEGERDALLARVEALEADNERLRQNTPPSNAAEAADEHPPPRTDDPLASRRSLMEALRDSYEKRFTDAGTGEPIEPTPEEVEAWAEQQARDFSGFRTWTVRLDPLLDSSGKVPTGGPRLASVRFIHSASLEPMGPPFTAEVPSRFFPRIADREPGSLWSLTGQMTAIPPVDPTRVQRGPFDHPPFIGPYAEFDFDLSWRRLIPETEDALKARAAAEARVEEAKAGGEPVER